MDMLIGEQIARAGLADWRKLGQGLHARFVSGDFAGGARFVTAIAEAGDAVSHHPRVSLGDGYVDLKLVSDDAIWRDDEGTEHVVEWVTQQDTEKHETPRQRFHIDVWVPPEVAEQRIAAAVAAGGTVGDDSQAPSFTVIADQDGNKACVCTSLPPYH